MMLEELTIDMVREIAMGNNVHLSNAGKSFIPSIHEKGIDHMSEELKIMVEYKGRRMESTRKPEIQLCLLVVFPLFI